MVDSGCLTSVCFNHYDALMLYFVGDCTNVDLLIFDW